jgi:hypothetical protein
MKSTIRKRIGSVTARPLPFLATLVGALLVLAGGLSVAERIYLLYRQWGSGFGPVGQIVSVVLLVAGIVLVALVALVARRSGSGGSAERGEADREG